MPEADAPISHAEKLKALRQIQYALGHSKHPTLRACGLTQDVAAAVANEGLVEAYIIADEGSDLDRYVINKISANGFGILAQGDVAELPPLKVSIQKHQESVWTRLFQATRNGLWDIIKVAAGAIIGWFLKKHFP